MVEFGGKREGLSLKELLQPPFMANRNRTPVTEVDSEVKRSREKREKIAQCHRTRMVCSFES